MKSQSPEIIYVASSIVPSKSANSIHVVKMSKAFSDLGYQVTLVCTKKKGDRIPEKKVKEIYASQGNFNIVRFERGHLVNYRFKILYDLIRYKLLEKDFMIYTRIPKIALFAMFNNIRCVLELHCPPKGFDKIALQLCAKSKNVILIVVITNVLKRHLANKYGISDNKIIVAPDAADPFPENIKPALPKEGKIRIGYLGHLYPGKGMEIISEIVPRMKHLDFVVVGGLKEDVAKWKERIGEQDNINFIDHVPHEETASWIKSFDIALLPNQRSVGVYGAGKMDIGPWTSPLKVFEYMSAGLPIVASDLENLREVLVDEYNALLCPSDSIDHWINAINRLVKDADLRKELGIRAKKDFLKKYTWRKRAQEIIKQASLISQNNFVTQ